MPHPRWLATNPIPFAVLGCSILCAGAGVVAAAPASDLIAKGDVHYERLEPEKALTYYLPAEKADPKNAQLLIKIARQYRHLMSDATALEDKLKYGEVALLYVERAVALAPNDSEIQLAVAITYAKLLPFKGGNREKMEASRRIKVAADATLKLDPKNDLGWHILGKWNYVLANIGKLKKTLGGLMYGKFPDASNEEAVVCFTHAIRLNPTRPMHYIELGRTFAEMGRTADARRYIEKGLAMPNTEKDDPETKEKGRETLAKLPNG
jgi:tetratricopeptide (TPR) repeat protein